MKQEVKYWALVCIRGAVRVREAGFAFLADELMEAAMQMDAESVDEYRRNNPPAPTGNQYAHLDVTTFSDIQQGFMRVTLGDVQKSEDEIRHLREQFEALYVGPPQNEQAEPEHKPTWRELPPLL